MKKWHFPLINPVKKWRLQHFINHVREEVEEFEIEENLIDKAKECVDVLHSAETLVRKFFAEHPDLSFDDIKKQVIEKNTKRGYYSH